MRRTSAFTLIELIISIIVIAIAAIPVAVTYQRAMQGSVTARMLTVATALSEQKMEEALNLGFSNIANISLTSFASPFNDYAYQVIVYYVNAADLNTSVGPTATEYKRVEVRVTNNFSAPVSLVSLLTNN
jgi:prepilin-type N-terminal cleavage/methylation domain-containing protein